MTTYYFAELDESGEFISQHHIQWNGVGPPPPPEIMEGYEMLALDAPFPMSGPTSTCRLRKVENILQWVETASLEELRQAKNREIDDARADANRTYFNFLDKRVACDDLSWKDIISANAEISLTREMPEGWVGGWKTMDKSYVAIPDVTTWTMFIKAMVSRGTSHFNHAQQLKALLAAAETPEQIAAIKWETANGQ